MRRTSSSAPSLGASARSVLAKWSIYGIGFVPAGWALYQGATGELGAEPIREFEHVLGLWSLRYLMAGLSITPLRQIARVNLLRYRRAVGLLAFFYGALHLTVYLVLDQGLDLEAVWADVVKRPYITVGVLSFSLLVPLAATSNNAVIRKMGGAAWVRLHKLVYVAVPAAVVHFILVVKIWPAELLVYGALIIVLLGYRLLRWAIRGNFRGRTPERRSRAAASGSV